MRDTLKSNVRGWAGWLWVAVALLALPNCALDSSGTGGPAPHLDPGALPHTSAIMCDIETFNGRQCASPGEDLTGMIPLASAALALTSGQSSNIGLDYSEDALTRCGGQPEKVTFQGVFPDGFAVCLNCGAGTALSGATAVCVAQCQDLSDASDSLTFCTAHAHPSTNFTTCFDNACSMGGTLRPDFSDPRRNPEPVIWQDLNGTDDGGGTNNLQRSAPTSVPSAFDAGAASKQRIEHGDGYVEFEASEANKSHVLGLSSISGCADPCSDSDPSLVDIGLAISLNADGRFYVLEGGSLIAGPDLNGSFGTYAANARFRVKVKDKLNGTSEVTYAVVNGPCVVGMPCPDTVFYTHAGTPSYPLRVDTSFREQNATLANVNIVRIQ